MAGGLFDSISDSSLGSTGRLFPLSPYRHLGWRCCRRQLPIYTVFFFLLIDMCCLLLFLSFLYLFILQNFYYCHLLSCFRSLFFFLMACGLG